MWWFKLRFSTGQRNSSIPLPHETAINNLKTILKKLYEINTGMHSARSKNKKVGCIPPACQTVCASDVSAMVVTSNTIEQVSSDVHQISLLGAGGLARARGVPCQMYIGRPRPGGSHVRCT